MSMRQINDGGAAFPQLEVVSEERDGHGDLIEPFTRSSGGMSLRDWFAGQALIAVIAATSAGQHQPNTRKGDSHIRFAIARDAFDMADAMLAARSEGRS